MSEHPIDLLNDGVRSLNCLQALFCELEAPVGERGSLQFVDPGDLCVILRLIIERFEKAIDGLQTRQQA